MRAQPFYSKTTVAVAIGVIVISTGTLGYLSYYYTIGRANLIEATLVQSNNKLVDQTINQIEQKLIDNDAVLYNLVDVNEPVQWPATAEAIRRADLNVEQVWFLLPSGKLLYPPSHPNDQVYAAFRRSFFGRNAELKFAELRPDETNHLHREKREDYFFATYVIKETRTGEHILLCFQMNFDANIALVNRYLKDLRNSHYVSIVDFENNAVFGEPMQRSVKYYYERRFPSTLYKWILQAVPRNYTELEREEKSQRRLLLLLILLSLFLTLLSLGFIYAASRRERQLVQLKEDFIANVSHELKTPLSLIRMFSEILVSGRVKDDRTRREYFGIIHSESDRMSRLIGNLLDFASLERGTRGKHFEPTDIGALVAKQLESYRYQIQKEGFELSTEIGPTPETYADPTAFSLAFFNLVDNSLKYSGDRKELRVRVATSNGFIDLEVSDRGPGIPKAEQEQIFEKFYRGADPIVQKTRGNGIGLSITKQVAEMHGGEVRVRSEPGAGSTFTLRIPIRPAPPQ
jgi:two-component system phosphate regulon sensor histidine kinase PhoR